MADEIVYAGIGDLTTAEVLSTKYLLLLADRNAIPAHPAIQAGYIGDIAGRGSNVVKVSHAGILGYDIMATGSEGSATANTALTDGSSTVTVVQKDKVYEYSDLARMIDASGIVRPDVFAADAVISASATMLSMLANLVDNFSTTTGSSGVDATFANFLDAITALEVAKVMGPYLAVLHPTQWGDIRKDVAATTGGAIQWNAGSQLILDGMKGLGAKGKFLDVDVFTTSHVPSANGGADRAGGMFGAGAIVWADGTIAADWSDPNVMTIADKVVFERIRSGRAGLTALLSRRFVGMAEGIDTAGVSIITDL